MYLTIGAFADDAQVVGVGNYIYLGNILTSLDFVFITEIK